MATADVVISMHAATAGTGDASGECHGSRMRPHLWVVKVVLLSATRFPADFTQTASLHVSKHDCVCSVGYQEAILVHIDPLYFVLKPGFQHYASSCGIAHSLMRNYIHSNGCLQMACVRLSVTA